MALEPTDISSHILKNVNFISGMYRIIKQACLEASKDKRVYENRNKTCTLPFNQEGTNRLSVCTESEAYEIRYDANDLMIVGGSCLNIYDFKLQEFKEKYKMGELEMYVKKKTSDIDMVLWPRTTQDIVTTSSSKAIETFVDVFEEKLSTELSKSENIEQLKTLVRGKVLNIKNIDTFNIYIEPLKEYQRHIKIAGIWNIELGMTINDYPKMKIADIIIHDNSSSQKYDKNGKISKSIQSMLEDPIYCIPKPGYINSITYFNIDDTDIAVPNLFAFINQQIFAFDNLIRLKNIKAFINYKRIIFIKKLLLNFDLSMRMNMNTFITIFGTDNPAYLGQLIEYLYKNLRKSFILYNSQILDVCKLANVKNDGIIQSLCENIKLEPRRKELEAFKLNEIYRLEEYKNILKQKSVSIPEEYHYKYIELANKIMEIQRQLDLMNLSQLLDYQKKYKETTDAEIQNKIKQINIEINRELQLRYPVHSTPSPVVTGTYMTTPQTTSKLVYNPGDGKWYVSQAAIPTPSMYHTASPIMYQTTPYYHGPIISPPSVPLSPSVPYSAVMKARPKGGRKTLKNNTI